MTGPIRDLLSRMEPVRPLAPERYWVAALAAIFVAIAVAGAARLGFFGVNALSAAQLIVILGLLAAAAIAAAIGVAREMAPAGMRALHPAALAAISIGLFAAAAALLFRDYSVARFGSGIRCLRAGLLFAAPAAAMTWIVARRGFILDRVAAGTGIGLLAGLTGLAMLELHCPILTAPHVIVWHAGVLVLSAAAGAIAGRLAR